VQNDVFAGWRHGTLATPVEMSTPPSPPKWDRRAATAEQVSSLQWQRSPANHKNGQQRWPRIADLVQSGRATAGSSFCQTDSARGEKYSTVMCPWCAKTRFEVNMFEKERCTRLACIAHANKLARRDRRRRRIYLSSKQTIQLYKQ